MLFGVAAQPICHLTGFIYPAYASFKAIKTHEPDDDYQWLTYWVIYALFTAFEFWTQFFFSQFPLYWELKLAFIIWLQAPQFLGAIKLYREFVEPFFKKHENSIDKAIADVSDYCKAQIKEYGMQLFNMAKEKVLGSEAGRKAVYDVMSSAMSNDAKNSQKKDE
eukprot:gb/GECH01013247.1/.p1 GENE.gb/GECH01013247.1/~~gb/GECH01013247.1/.p1  ORF type:complete len:164 (+),score=30.77 gb/GECH01013247.1/:1-492(+)